MTYEELKAAYEAAVQKCSELEKENDELKKSNEDKKYDAVTELTPEVLNDFIEKIEVGRYKNSDKKNPFAEREYEISVFFWGVGIINFLENLLP